MFGDLRKTADRFLLVKVFGVQIAENIQRAEVFRVVFDHALIFVDCRSNLALRQKSFGIPHSFCFIEAHCESNAFNSKFVYNSI